MSCKKQLCQAQKGTSDMLAWLGASEKNDNNKQLKVFLDHLNQTD